jgi:hypothetical protein
VEAKRKQKGKGGERSVGPASKGGRQKENKIRRQVCTRMWEHTHMLSISSLFFFLFETVKKSKNHTESEVNDTTHPPLIRKRGKNVIHGGGSL